MSAEIPALSTAFALLLVSAPFLVLALRRAGRVLPRRAAVEDHWPTVQALCVLALPLALLALLDALVSAPEPGAAAAEPAVLPSLIGTQLVFGSAAALAVVLAARRPAGLAGLGLGAGVPPGAFGSVTLVYLPGLFFTVGLGILWAQLCRARGWDERQEVLHLILTLERGELIFAGLIAILLGPLIEELVFRGFLQAWLAQHMGERAALLGTAVLFASLHGVAGLPILLGLSLFLGWLQQRTRCLWVPWSAHALNNAVTLGLALAAPHE